MAGNCNCNGMSSGLSSVFYQDPRFELYKAIISGWSSRSNSVGFESASKMADEAWEVWCNKHGIKTE